MKLLLHYQTELGGVTVVVDQQDEARARAVMRAHQALGETAAIVDTVPRCSVKEHMAKHKRRANKAKVVTPPGNVLSFGAGKKK
jgi:hypothetical protein